MRPIPIVFRRNKSSAALNRSSRLSNSTSVCSTWEREVDASSLSLCLRRFNSITRCDAVTGADTSSTSIGTSVRDCLSFSTRSRRLESLFPRSTSKLLLRMSFRDIACHRSASSVIEPKDDISIRQPCPIRPATTRSTRMRAFSFNAPVIWAERNCATLAAVASSPPRRYSTANSPICC